VYAGTACGLRLRAVPLLPLQTLKTLAMLKEVVTYMQTEGLAYVIDLAVDRQISDSVSAKYCECIQLLTELDLQFNERTAKQSFRAFTLTASMFEDFIVKHNDAYTKNEVFSAMLCLLCFELAQEEQYLEYRLLKLSKLN
jgi:hypothetical protein